ncbi:MAG: ABC transporter permease [Lachnospiraceae bacterium]|nr:ABC transporter permease [Lachnospiraceae bacterium]
MFFLSEIRRHIWRNKGRSLLSVGIAALLVSFVGIYIGNIRKNEVALKSLADTITVTAQITNQNGSRLIGLEIMTNRLDALLSADITEPLYTAQAGGNLELINRVEFVKACDTTIIGANSLQALLSVSGEEIIFADGWDETYLEGKEPVCVVSESYAARHDISIGDTLSFPMYIYKFNKDGYTFNFIKVGEPSLTVIGTFQQGSDSSDTQNMIVPINWLRLFVEESGNTFYYDSARCTIKNPLYLNDFKAYMKEKHFGEAVPKADDRRSGDELIVQDRIFIETASKLQENIKTFRWFQIPFFLIIILLIQLVSFLILRSYRQEMAIASSLGHPKLSGAASYFLETMFLYLSGCILVLPMLMGVAGIGFANMMLIFLLFFICACIGIWVALLLLLRFDTIALLTKID